MSFLYHAASGTFGAGGQGVARVRQALHENHRSREAPSKLGSGVSTFLVGQTIVFCRLPSIRRSTIAIGGGRPPSRPLRDYSRYRRSNLGALPESVSNGRTIRLAKTLCRSALESGLTGEPFFPSAIALPSTFQQAAERSHERGSA